MPFLFLQASQHTTNGKEGFRLVYASHEGRLPAYGSFKDNDGRRDYNFGEMVSELGGNDVRTIQPPFSIFPIEDKGRPCVWEGGAEDQVFVVENITFEYTIPMLTGWELGYGHVIKVCDEHLTEIGIQIDEWNYEKTHGTSAGTMLYKLTSAFDIDSGNQVDESDNKGNNSVGGNCVG